MGSHLALINLLTMVASNVLMTREIILRTTIQVGVLNGHLREMVIRIRVAHRKETGRLIMDQDRCQAESMKEGLGQGIEIEKRTENENEIEIEIKTETESGKEKGAESVKGTEIDMVGVAGITGSQSIVPAITDIAIGSNDEVWYASRSNLSWRRSNRRDINAEWATAVAHHEDKNNKC